MNELGTPINIEITSRHEKIDKNVVHAKTRDFLKEHENRFGKGEFKIVLNKGHQTWRGQPEIEFHAHIHTEKLRTSIKGVGFGELEATNKVLKKIENLILKR